MSVKLKFIISALVIYVIAIIYGLFSRHYDAALNSVITINCA